MDNTFGTFQGFPVRAVTYRRGRGYTPGGAEIIMVASDFPAKFNFAAPAPGALTVAAQAPDQFSAGSGSAVANRPSGPAPLARSLSYEGWLVMSETVGGETWKHPPVRLFVVRVDTVRLADLGGVALIRIQAWDERYHWEHGWLRRWSFNRKRADGTVSQDSLNPDGSPVTHQQVATAVVASLFRKPALAHSPSEWAKRTTALDFGVNPAAVTALASMVREADLEEPCLRLDGKVALHRAGEGFVGYAEGGEGPNARAFPPGVLLWKDGAGQGVSVELGYPEDFVLVAGGPRVATVAIDDCTPIVTLEDVDFKLTEANVRFLTGGRRGLDWIWKFVFSPPEWAGDPDIPEPVLEAFRTQAGRRWQIPGVEREEAADDRAQPMPRGPEADGDAALDMEGERLSASLFGASPAAPGAAKAGGRRRINRPGPNAHLMPMLARAELSGSKRLPVTVETYTFAVRRRKLGGSGAAAKQFAALEELARLRSEIAARAAQQGNPNPFNPEPRLRFGKSKRTFGDAITTPNVQKLTASSELDPEAVRTMSNAGVTTGELNDFVATARTVDRIREQAGEGYAGLYENAMKERFAAEDSASGASTNGTLYDLAKKFLEAEKTANDQGGLNDTTQEALRKLGLDKLFSAEVAEAMRKLRLQKEATRTRGGAEGANEVQTFFVNVARTIDGGARVVDEERGIVETSGLAGHLLDPAVHDLGHADAELHACPVRVTFGTHLRPRVDVPPLPPGATVPRARTGEGDDEPIVEGPCPGGATVIPKVLGDEESYFLRAFQRGPSGAPVAIALDKLPADQALVIQRPDLCELVPLEGEGNVADLERQASEIAAEFFKRPAVVKSATATIARAWPVQCDGLIEEVTIQMRMKDGIPCGYETVLSIGGDGQAKPGGATRERGAAALRAQHAAATRERRTP